MIIDLLPCAILIPSLNRPQNLRATVENIHSTTPEEHRILFCVADAESKAILDDLGEWYLDDGDVTDHRYVTRMNKLVKGEYIGDAKSVFFGSDDVRHHDGWLSRALGVMCSQGKAVVVVNDLRNHNGTQAVVRVDYLTRAVFDDPDVAFHPGYLHNFADTEMFVTASANNEYARALDSVVEHLHPIWQSPDALPWDSTYSNAQAGWQADSDLFNERMRKLSRMFG